MLRRLDGTPMPSAAYFLGRIWLVLVTGLLEAAIPLGVGTGAGALERAPGAQGTRRPSRRVLAEP